jgi:hypothetical protein
VQNETSAQGLYNTQEHVYQTTPETLTQHYELLANAMVALSGLYASTGAARIGAVYSRVAAQLLSLSSVFVSRYPTYDKAISTPRGVISLNILPDNVYKCASKYLSATLPPGDSIGGTFTSYVKKGLNDEDSMDFSGSIGFVGDSDNWQVQIQASPIVITSASIVPAWGLAQYDYVTQQISSSDVLWTATGFPGGWNVAVGTSWVFVPSPAGVGVQDLSNSASSTLALC